MEGASHLVDFRVFLGDGTHLAWTEGPFTAQQADPIVVPFHPPEAVGGKLAYVAALVTALHGTTEEPVAHMQADPVFAHRDAAGRVHLTDPAGARILAGLQGGGLGRDGTAEVGLVGREVRP